MMLIRKFTVGALATNCYLYTDHQSGESVLVDPGYMSQELHRSVEQERIKYILLTHAHIDHIFAAAQVKRMTGAQLVVHPAEQNRLADTKLNLYDAFAAAGAYKEEFEPVAADIQVNDGDFITIGASRFAVMHTPGHTEGSVCYLNESVIFSGDTLFCESYGRVDFPGGSYSSMIDSYYRLMQLDGDYTVYPGHQGSTTLKNERIANPLRKYLV